MEKLINEFNSMDSMPIFEINIEDAFYVYYVEATEKGLEAGGCSNTGFMAMGLEYIEWDNRFSLNEHLEELYEVCYFDAVEEYKGEQS